MIYVGIDVAKDKHDCFIFGSDRVVLSESFSFPNTRAGFASLLKRIYSFESDACKIKVGLEATGHYSYNLLGFLLDNGLATYVFNPLHTNLYRKSLSLRLTKTDRIDSRTIAGMLMSDLAIKPYTEKAYHNQELKSLTRYRFSRIQLRSKLKVSVSRLVSIVFPELEALVNNIHGTAVYALLDRYPSAEKIGAARVKSLVNLLSSASAGHYDEAKAVLIRTAAKNSIGTALKATSTELRHTIRLIGQLDKEIAEIETDIEDILSDTDQLIETVPGISKRTAAAIVSEVGDFSAYASPDKILAFAGMSPSTYQSGKITNCYAHMEKRGSKYLRYALYTATRSVCQWEPGFKAYLAKKRAEGKHYNVALAHAAKKLIRLLYAMEKHRCPYKQQIVPDAA